MKSNDAGGHRWPRVPMVFLFIAGVTCGCGGGKNNDADNPANAPKAAVVMVQRRDLSDTLEIASEFLPFQEIDVYAKVSGYIQKLDVDWGTHVKRGQLLAVLEIPELQQQLLQDEADVRHSEQDVARAHEEMTSAESAYDVSHLTYTRLEDVDKSRPGLVAQEEVDEAHGKDIQGNAGVSAAKDSLAGSQQALAAAQAMLEKDRVMFGYARITAPFDGVVTQVNAYTGALLPAGTSSNKGDLSLCHLSQNNLLRLVIPVPEEAVPDVKDGETIAVKVSALNKTFQGQIVRIAGQIDMDTRTMHTEVDVPNADYVLVPGMYASVEIPLHHLTQVLTAPIQAVQTSGNGQGSVLVVNAANQIERRGVTLGLETATEYEVTGGLREGERVIFGEQSQYRQGELVSPQIVQPGAAPAQASPAPAARSTSTISLTPPPSSLSPEGATAPSATE
ncbi:MAG: efflux RND transporter periplasmic adaptor subunit [Candidatus Acidiferrales bacterium]